MNLSSIFLFIFLIILLSFILNYTHLLLSLLCLEAIILVIVQFIPITIYFSSRPINQLRLILLTIRACEASLGLRIVVKLSRNYGSDLLSSSAINSC